MMSEDPVFDGNRKMGEKEEEDVKFFVKNNHLIVWDASRTSFTKRNATSKNFPKKVPPALIYQSFWPRISASSACRLAKSALFSAYFA